MQAKFFLSTAKFWSHWRSFFKLSQVFDHTGEVFFKYSQVLGHVSEVSLHWPNLWGQVIFLSFQDFLTIFTRFIAMVKTKLWRIKEFYYMLLREPGVKIICLAFKSTSFSMKIKFRKSRIFALE